MSKWHVPASESAQVGPAAIRSRAFLHSGSIKPKTCPQNQLKSMRNK
jgi:hypothetical protein